MPIKYLFTVILMLSVFGSVAQSSDHGIVLLKDGYTFEGEIKIIASDFYFVRLTDRKGERSFNRDQVVEYSIDGQWYSKDFESKEFRPVSQSKYRIRTPFFKTDSRHRQERFSLGLAFGMGNPNKVSGLSLFTISDNPTLRLRSEYRFNEKWSLISPVVFGFGLKRKGEITQQSAISTPDYLESRKQGAYHTYKGLNWWHATAPTTVDPEVDRTKYFAKDIHTRETAFEIGIGTKYYMFGHRRRSLYLAGTVNYGRGNFNTVDYYATFKPIYDTTWNGTVDENWQFSKEEMVGKYTAFNYLRASLAIGLDIDISRNFKFSLEVGYASGMESINDDEHTERVYISTDGVNYNLDREYVYNPYVLESDETLLPGIITSRFYLVYKFGGEQK